MATYCFVGTYFLVCFNGLRVRYKVSCIVYLVAFDTKIIERAISVIEHECQLA